MRYGGAADWLTRREMRYGDAADWLTWREKRDCETVQ
jgi:hypothetical protein